MFAVKLTLNLYVCLYYNLMLIKKHFHGFLHKIKWVVVCLTTCDNKTHKKMRTYKIPPDFTKRSVDVCVRSKWTKLGWSNCTESYPTEHVKTFSTQIQRTWRKICSVHKNYVKDKLRKVLLRLYREGEYIWCLESQLRFYVIWSSEFAGRVFFLKKTHI